MRFEVRVWVSFSLRRKKGHVSAYRSGEQSARRPPRRSAARRDRRLDKKTAPVSVLRRQHFPLLRIARRRIPTHRPARSGHSRGPGRRERACRSRRSQHAGARLHLWCGKGGRGEKGERRRKVKVKVERGEEAPFFFFCSTSRPRPLPSTFPSSSASSPPAPKIHMRIGDALEVLQNQRAR